MMTLTATTPRLLIGLLLLPALAVAVDMHVTISPETAADFERAAKIVEGEYRGAIAAKRPFLLGRDKEDALRQAREGSVITLKIRDERLKVKGALSHYWMGAMFDPNGSIDDYLKVLLDYPRHEDYYAEVIKSELVSRNGAHYQSRLRLKKKKVLTAVLDVDFKSDLERVDDRHVFLRALATRITEVQRAGQPDEKELPVGADSGFLWRQNSYWFLRETDGGLYVELASFSLSRSIPTGLGWMIKPFITSIPKDTIEKTLQATRVAAHQ